MNRQSKWKQKKERKKKAKRKIEREYNKASGTSNDYIAGNGSF